MFSDRDEVLQVAKELHEVTMVVHQEVGVCPEHQEELLRYHSEGKRVCNTRLILVVKLFQASTIAVSHISEDVEHKSRDHNITVINTQIQIRTHDIN